MDIKIQFFRDTTKPVTAWRLFKVWLGILAGTSLVIAAIAWNQQEPPQYGVFIGVLFGGTIGLFIQYLALRRRSGDVDHRD